MRDDAVLRSAVRLDIKQAERNNLVSLTSNPVRLDIKQAERNNLVSLTSNK